MDVIPTGGKENVEHEEFARRAAWRLEAMANRTEEEALRLGIHGEALGRRTRAQQMRVAAFLVRQEALAVSEAEEVAAVGSPKALAEWPPLEAQA
jgi:predicted DNA-binding protein (UPF0251 family)